jgi:hypothetical protein
MYWYAQFFYHTLRKPRESLAKPTFSLNNQGRRKGKCINTLRLKLKVEAKRTRNTSDVLERSALGKVALRDMAADLCLTEF